jgi:hypothetical protein
LLEPVFLYYSTFASHIMANTTISPLLGNCIAPFLDEARFPTAAQGAGGCTSIQFFHAILTLTIYSPRRTILRTNRLAAGNPLMLLALSSNRLGLPRHIRHIQQDRRMAQCHRTDPAVLHAGQLHRLAYAKDSKSLPLSMSDHRRNDDLPWIHNPTWIEHRAVLR